MSDHSNQLCFHPGALAFAGGALAGEGIDDARAQACLDEAASLLHDHMIPAMNQEAGGDGDLLLQGGFTGNGGWGEDMVHTGMTHPLLGRMVEAWRTGTGEDVRFRPRDTWFYLRSGPIDNGHQHDDQGNLRSRR